MCHHPYSVWHKNYRWRVLAICVRSVQAHVGSGGGTVHVGNLLRRENNVRQALVYTRLCDLTLTPLPPLPIAKVWMCLKLHPEIQQALPDPNKLPRSQPNIRVTAVSSHSLWSVISKEDSPSVLPGPCRHPSRVILQRVHVRWKPWNCSTCWLDYVLQCYSISPSTKTVILEPC